MRILIDPGTTNCRNVGDVAVLQAAVARLRDFEPDATIDVFTADPAELETHCPSTRPVDELARRRLLAREFGKEVRPASARGRPLDRFRGMVRGIGRQRGSRAAAEAVGRQLDDTDLFVVCGQATLADADRVHALRLLHTALLAQRRGIPVAFFSQGIGPLTDPAILSLMGPVLGSAAVVGVRERLAALPILERLGVPADRIVVTGDDAVESAYAARPAGIGTGLGVHMRIAPLAARSPEAVERLRPILQRAASDHGASMIPLPISHHRGGGAYDPATIRSLLAGYDDASDGGAGLTTPALVAAAAGQCRVVVTGAYHAAVFALAQGVPAIVWASRPTTRRSSTGWRTPSAPDARWCASTIPTCRSSCAWRSTAPGSRPMRSGPRCSPRRSGGSRRGAPRTPCSSSVSAVAPPCGRSIGGAMSNGLTRARPRVALVVDHPKRDLAGLVLTAVDPVARGAGYSWCRSTFRSPSSGRWHRPRCSSTARAAAGDDKLAQAPARGRDPDVVLDTRERSVSGRLPYAYSGISGGTTTCWGGREKQLSFACMWGPRTWRSAPDVARGIARCAADRRDRLPRFDSTRHRGAALRRRVFARPLVLTTELLGQQSAVRDRGAQSRPARPARA